VRRRIIISITVAVIGVVVYFVNRVAYVVRHIPEAYTAWDTSTLLVSYMRANEERWPSSWDDLLLVTNRYPGVLLAMHGTRPGETDYFSLLRNRVSIDWHFVPKTGFQGLPVRRPDGTAFPIVWQGADPNQMIRAELGDSHPTNAPKSP
jgi:hypothetical protein